MKFDELRESYKNTPEWHGEMFDTLYGEVQHTPWLKEHRDWIETNQWGMGDRPMHELWRSVVETMPDGFKFLEVGVYRGQTPSLVGLAAKQMGKTPVIYGLSPFAGTHDTVNSYSRQLNYLGNVRIAFDKFGVPWEWFIPIIGMSQQSEIVDRAKQYAPYDIIYIDGCHETDKVRQDIENYSPMLAEGGILVMDDASCYLNMPEFTNACGYNRCWPGMREVSDAVRDFLETRTDFEHCFAIGHNRVFRKVKR